MLRTGLESALRERQSDDGYLFPAYEDYCFANVLDTVQDALGVEAERPLPADVFDDGSNADRVVVFLVDGFGLEQWKRHCEDSPLLERVTEDGTVTPLTSIYPSETAAAIRTIHTGHQPVEHGVVGWNVYEPTADVEFEYLPFLTKDGEEPPLERTDVAEGASVYPDLRERGIDCRHVVPFEATCDGAALHRYDEADPETFVQSVGEAAEAARDPSYLYVYLPQIDHAGHEHGTRSQAYAETVHAVWDTLERALAALERSTPAGGRTLVVFTADHGHIDTDPDRNVDLERFEPVMSNLARRGDGTPIRFAGSPRNVHLHLREGSVDGVAECLQSNLDARVFRREEAIESGLFGDREAGESIRRRAGDLVCTHRNLSVWYDAERAQLETIGMHGGLSAEEMLVPFATIDLEDVHADTGGRR